MRESILCCILMQALLLSASTTFADIKSDMDALTGSTHTRVVWLNGGDRINGGGKLMGYDSRTNQTTQILPATSKQNRPILCSGGHRVIVSIDYKVYIVDWNGSNKEYLVDGICSDVWVHPSTGKEWIVVRTGAKSTSGDLYRYLLENPSEEFLLYDAKRVGIDYFQWWQISPDGKMAVDFLPWSKCYLITNGGLESNGNAEEVSNGCWSSVVKDNSRYWYHLTCCPHKTLKVFKNADFIEEVTINAGPRPSGTKSDEFYHPKSASKGPRFLTVTGGYHGNSGSSDAEVYLGKWDSDYKGFAGWVRLTNNGNSDYTPDAWVGVEEQDPSLSLSADTIRFSAQENGPNPPSQEITVTSAFGSLEGVSVQSDQQWLTAELSGSEATYTITNTVSIASLSADIHTATVTVHANNTNPSQKRYTAIVTVEGAPTPESIELSPYSQMLTYGATVHFEATVLDQFGNPLSHQPSLEWTVSGNCGVIDNSGLFTAGETEGVCTVKATAGSLVAEASVEVVESIPVTIKVNCGDNSPAVSGWESDAQYLVSGSEGDPYDFGGAHDLSGASNAAPHDVYQTVRHKNHAYSFADIPDGNYTVRLHFTDGHTGGDGRAMDYTIEGEKVIDNFSIQQEAGGINKAIVKEFTVTVADGNGMQIVCDSDQGNDVFEAGIEITSGAGSVPIQITSDYSGQTLAVGDQMLFTWEATEDIIGVVIEISPNSGRDYYSILSKNAIMPADPEWAQGYAWTIPESIADSDGNPVSVLSENVMVKIYNYGGEENDICGPFSITSPGVVSGANKLRSATSPRVSLSPGGVVRIVGARGSTVCLCSPNGAVLKKSVLDSKQAFTWSMHEMPAGMYFIEIAQGARRVNASLIWTK